MPLKQQVEDRPRPNRTLHDAMVLVLKRYEDKSLTPQELSDIIYKENLYLTKLGTKAEVGQIYARSAKYPHIFSLRCGRIYLL